MGGLSLIYAKGVSVETEELNCYLDFVLLDDYLDRLGKKIVEQMLALYCQQSVIYLTDIENAQLNNSQSDWQEHCHKMKGATASVGMYKLYEQLKSLEKSEASTEEKLAFVAALKISNEQAIAAFKRWLQSL